MDLSAVIFVVLALAWAVYLIPKALQHHDEMAGDRLEHGHSEKVRVLSRQRRREVSEDAAGAEEPEVETADSEVEAVEPEVSPEPEVDEVPVPARRPSALPTRASARRAARNRRRVLAVLLLATIATGVCAWYAVTPAWSPAIPGGLVVAFLVTARMSVRKMNAARATRPAARPTTRTAAPAGIVEAPAETAVLTERLAEEHTSAPERAEIEAALADDGSLWDPLPMTLPTYVTKARARRTVRTIELTGMTSSGHDLADSTLAREAREAASAAQEAEAEQSPVERRRAAGA